MGKIKPIVHSPKKCGGTYEVIYNDDDIPFLKCDTCEHEINDWVKWTNEYKDYWMVAERWDEKKNHITCLLGYFAYKFNKHYEFEYAWSLNDKGLFRGPEANILRRVYSAFNKDPGMVKDYIDWYFAVKIKRRKKRITSLSFLAVPALMNEFKIVYKKSQQITRDRKLPGGMLRWIRDFAPSIQDFQMEDYGDLKHMLEIYKARQIDNEHVNKFVAELKRQNVICEDCQIRNWRD